MRHDGSQNNEISFSSWSIGKILAEDQDRAELLYGYTITRTSEKAGSYCSRICTFLSNTGLVHLLFASFPPISKARKILYILPSTHDLAIEFWMELRAKKLHCQFLLTFCGFILRCLLSRENLNSEFSA